MSREKTATKDFPFKRLAELLKCSRKFCIVGYEFSWESHLPHFNDILKGVWSETSTKPPFNPFTSASDYRMVMNWFEWRRQTIVVSAIQFEPIQVLLRMQKADPKFKIATQCVDGVMNMNGFDNAYELYGNVFQAICHDNGHEFATWPGFGTNDQRISCEICGSIVLPNVEMFGWNKKSAVRMKVMDLFEKSGVLILIGVDKNLAPFSEMNDGRLTQLPIIEIQRDCITLRDRDVAYVTSINSIENNVGEKLSSPRDWSLTRTMRYLSLIH